MRRAVRFAVASVGIWLLAFVVVTGRAAGRPHSEGWNPQAAAAYLDGRAMFWTTWPNAARDHGTFCISCHTTLPFALARPALRTLLGERAPGPAESAIFANLLKRARGHREMEPFYPDQTRGVPKTSESRAIEAVMNAVVLARRDRELGRLGDDTKVALDQMWALQMKTGPQNGAWTWLNFGYEPFESPNSPYFGAALAALAVGAAPDGYAASPDVQEKLGELRRYFQRELDSKSTLNQLMALWASGAVPDLLTPQQRSAVVERTFGLQQPDGGWRTASLGGYARLDGTTIDGASDGYGTALATLALQSAGVAASDGRVARGLAWLRSHQASTGQWLATSPNKDRDPASEPAKFMSDAATGMAVLALTFGN